MTNRISAKVAQILNSRDLVINRGSNSGVTLGMQFKILNSRGQRIIDPETHEELGSLDLEKAVVKVTKLYENMAICSTFRVTGGGYTNAFYGALSTELLKFAAPRMETLETGAETQKEIDLKKSVVEVGDEAIQIVNSTDNLFSDIDTAKNAIANMHNNEMQYEGDWRPVYVHLDLLSAFEKALKTITSLSLDSKIVEKCTESLAVISDLKRDLRAEIFSFMGNTTTASRFEAMSDTEISNAIRPDKLGGLVTRHTGLAHTYEEELSRVHAILNPI